MPISVCALEVAELKLEKEELEKQLRTRYMQQVSSQLTRHLFASFGLEVNETSKRRDAERLLHAAELKFVSWISSFQLSPRPMIALVQEPSAQGG